METNENLFGFQQIEASTKSKSTLIIEGVRKEVKEYLLEKNHDTDSTDGVSKFLSTLFKKIQEELHERRRQWQETFF